MLRKSLSKDRTIMTPCRLFPSQPSLFFNFFTRFVNAPIYFLLAGAYRISEVSFWLLGVYDLNYVQQYTAFNDISQCHERFRLHRACLRFENPEVAESGKEELTMTKLELFSTCSLRPSEKILIMIYLLISKGSGSHRWSDRCWINP